MMAGRGALVVLEGCDRAGKSTQCKKLVDYLLAQNVKAKSWCFPDRSTAIGKTISEYLECKQEIEDHTIHLLFSANRWEATPKMKKELESGTTLIVDRYAYSGAAFTASKPGFTLQWCKQPDVGLLRPDLVVFLDLPLEEAAKRGDFGKERYEKSDFQTRVGQLYIQLSRLAKETWVNVNAGGTEESVHRTIADIAMKAIVKSKSEPLSTLWTNENDLITKDCSVP